MNKKEKLRKRDLALQAVYWKVQELLKELESKYPELAFVNIEEAQSGKSDQVKNHG